MEEQGAAPAARARTNGRRAGREAGQAAERRAGEDGGGPDHRDAAQSGYATGAYWASRSDLLYYRYVDYILRAVAAEARSLIDVGTGGSPYLEWFDWIPERVSFDLRHPYRSETVEGIAGDLVTHRFERRFDVCACLQVLEHVPDAAAFARRLLEIARLVVVSVPHRWPEGRTRGHLHDPVTREKLEAWMGRRPNYAIVVQEPFRTAKAERLIALYDEDPARRFGRDVVEGRRIRATAV